MQVPFKLCKLWLAKPLTTLQSESVESLFFATDQEINKKYKGAIGGFRTWLTEDKTADLPAYLTSEVRTRAVMHGVSKLTNMEQDHKHYQHIFSAGKGGYGPGINWYRASLRNINEEDEQSMYRFPLYPVYLPLPLSISPTWRLFSDTYTFHVLLTPNPEIPTSAHTLTHPTLLIASKNFITATINFPEQMRSHVPDLRAEKVNGGHWLQLEKADEVNKILEKFVKEKRWDAIWVHRTESLWCRHRRYIAKICCRPDTLLRKCNDVHISGLAWSLLII